MKTSLEWLCSYLDKPVLTDEATELLSRQGFPIASTTGAGDDVMLDVEVTSNRSDCLNHLGLAREVAAGSGRSLRQPGIVLNEAGGERVDTLTSVDNQATDLCPVYTARVIRNVKIGPSPAWLVRRLEAIGLRSINNVVDVTNYVLMEMGQPLHVFDMARLRGRRIVVRQARKGEAFTAIDGSKHQLEAGMLVIADAEVPVAVAGVMGGLDSEVGPSATDILLESAQFAPLPVRRTSRRLKLSSDSSFRFERGVDPLGVERASRRAAQLILELAGGELAPGVIRAGAAEPKPLRIAMRVARCNQILGSDLSAQTMVKLLGSLQLNPSMEGETVVCNVPTFRLDLAREVDLIEEVARMRGLDQVGINEKIRIDVRAPQPQIAARSVLGAVLAAHGYHETVTFSFTAPSRGESFVVPPDRPLMIEDERRQGEPLLRPSLLPSLLACRKSNQDVGNMGVRLFEVAATWTRDAAGGIVERRKLAMVSDSNDVQQGIRDLRGAIVELCDALGACVPVFEEATTANFSVSLRIVGGGGVIGVIDAGVLDRFGLLAPIVAAELDIDGLLAQYPPRRTVGELPRFPGIDRDLSVVIDEAVAWTAVERELRAAEPELLEAVEFVGVYRGKPIEKGRKSVTFRMRFRDPAATLRHEQVDGQVKTVVDRLTHSLGAQLRT